jgi:hypothetical protein
VQREVLDFESVRLSVFGELAPKAGDRVDEFVADLEQELLCVCACVRRLRKRKQQTVSTGSSRERLEAPPGRHPRVRERVQKCTKRRRKG